MSYVILGLSILAGVAGVVLVVIALRGPRDTQAEAGAGEAAVPARLDVAGLSDVGHVRLSNEDCLLTLEVRAARPPDTAAVHLLAVADGMGGQRAGEVASEIAARVLAERVSAELAAAPGESEEAAEPDHARLLSQAVQQANTAVHDAAQGDLRGMGTTLVAALVAGEQVTLANVGDSRAYLAGPDGIRQITVDHSLVQHLVATEQITPEEADRHPERHLIYRSLGQAPEVEVDTFAETLAADTWLVLCSDGLNRMLTDDEIRATVTAAPDCRAAAAALVERANAAGGEDNVTVVVARAGRRQIV